MHVSVLTYLALPATQQSAPKGREEVLSPCRGWIGWANQYWLGWCLSYAQALCLRDKLSEGRGPEAARRGSMLSEAGVSLCRLVSNTVAGDCTLGGSSKPSQTPSFLERSLWFCWFWR